MDTVANVMRVLAAPRTLIQTKIPHKLLTKEHHFTSSICRVFSKAGARLCTYATSLSTRMTQSRTISTRFPVAVSPETCCVSELYLALLSRKIITEDTAKVNLVLNEYKGFARRVRQLLDVADAAWGFRFSAYCELNDDGNRKRMVLDALHSALHWMAEERKWDVGVFNRCRSQILDHNFEYAGWSKKSWLCPSRKFRARIGFDFGLRSVDFVVGIFDRRAREIGRKPLGSALPEMGILALVLKSNSKWISGTTFRVTLRMPWDPNLPKSWSVNLAHLVN